MKMPICTQKKNNNKDKNKKTDAYPESLFTLVYQEGILVLSEFNTYA